MYFLVFNHSRNYDLIKRVIFFRISQFLVFWFFRVSLILYTEPEERRLLTLPSPTNSKSFTTHKTDYLFPVEDITFCDKYKWFDVEYVIYFTSEKGFFIISRFFFTNEINSIFNFQKIEFSVYYIFFWFLNMFLSNLAILDLTSQ